MSDFPDWESYWYPGTYVPRNKLDIRDRDELWRLEREFVALRASEGCPGGNFDLDHLKAIHRHLFQDVYEWAGERRTLDFTDAGHPFLDAGYIEGNMQRLHEHLVMDKFLHGLDADAFADKAGQVISDIFLAHPFYGGNGGAELQFLKQLGERAGHRIDLTKIDRANRIDASISANEGMYDELVQLIRRAIVPAGTKAAAPPTSGTTRDERLEKYSDLLDQEEAANERAARLREQVRAEAEKKTR